MCLNIESTSASEYPSSRDQWGGMALRGKMYAFVLFSHFSTQIP